MKKSLTDEEFRVLVKYERCGEQSCQFRDLDEEDRSVVEGCVVNKWMKLGHRRRNFIFWERIETACLTLEGYDVMVGRYKKRLGAQDSKRIYLNDSGAYWKGRQDY